MHSEHPQFAAGRWACDVYDSYGRHVNPTYPPFLRRLGLDSHAVRAEGAMIWDAAGRAFIDCTGGYGIFNLGHNHPAIIQAVVDQLHSRQPLTRPLITPVQAQLAERLAAATPGDLEYVFLCNSGSEAIDSALKLARLATGRKRIIAAHGSFHGFTYGALSVTGLPKFRQFFDPVVPETAYVPYGDTDALRAAVDGNTAAVLLEAVQHEAGVRIPPDDYLAGARRTCNDAGALLIVDEVKTGFGRTGSLFACTEAGITPDILVLGKSLGGGLIPSGAVVARSPVWKRFALSFPMSASSYAGNTLACAAGIKTLELLQESGLVDDCRAKGKLLIDGLQHLAEECPQIVRSVNGKGLLVSIRLASPILARSLSEHLIRDGVLAFTAFAANAEIMIEPPLVIDMAQIRTVLAAIAAACVSLSPSRGAN